MLVLTRKATESIHIDGHIVVRVIRTRPGAVRIGIEAPRDVAIVRGELVDPPAGGMSNDEDRLTSFECGVQNAECGVAT